MYKFMLFYSCQTTDMTEESVYDLSKDPDGIIKLYLIRSKLIRKSTPYLNMNNVSLSSCCKLTKEFTIFLS